MLIVFVLHVKPSVYWCRMELTQYKLFMLENALLAG